MRTEVQALHLIEESALSMEVLQKWKSLIAIQGGRAGEAVGASASPWGHQR